MMTTKHAADAGRMPRHMGKKMEMTEKESPMPKAKKKPSAMVAKMKALKISC